MSRETRERVIGDATYRVTALGGKLGRLVQLRLARSVAAALSSGKGFELAGLLPQLKGVFLDPSAALETLTPADLEFVCDTFAACTKVTVPDEGNAPKTMPLAVVYDDHLSGRRALDVWPWLAFCLEVNFGEGFFSGALAKLRDATARSPSVSRPASTGGSGDSASPSA